MCIRDSACSSASVSARGRSNSGSGISIMGWGPRPGTVSAVGRSVPAFSISFICSRRSFSTRVAAFFTSASSSTWVHRPSVTGSCGVRFGEFQCVRSRMAWMVGLVVPTRRMIWLSRISGWLRMSHSTALGRSWRRDTGV